LQFAFVDAAALMAPDFRLIAGDLAQSSFNQIA